MNAAAENIFVPPAPPAPPSTEDSSGGGEGDAVNLREAIERAQMAAGYTPAALDLEGSRLTWTILKSTERRAWNALDLPDCLLSLSVEDIVLIARHFGRNL